MCGRVCCWIIFSCVVLTTETIEKTQENCREQMEDSIFLCTAKVNLIFKLNIITFNLTLLFKKKCKPQVCVWQDNGQRITQRVIRQSKQGRRDIYGKKRLISNTSLFWNGHNPLSALGWTQCLIPMWKFAQLLKNLKLLARNSFLVCRCLKSGDHQGATSAECEADQDKPRGLSKNTIPKMDLMALTFCCRGFVVSPFGIFSESLQ